ncbi:MAG: mitochondrial Homoaconitase [Alectoria sarmentosa]|nr:MAG: mitochondrial Homoaconitase [Alectoria sarmentosa]
MLKRTAASLLRRRANGTVPTRALSQFDVFPSQIQDPSSAAVLSSLQKSPRVPQTMSEKIIQRYCLDLAKDQYVRAGDFVTLKPHACMTHDNSWPTALKFMSIGAKKIHDPSQIVFALDHDVQNKSDSNLKKYAQIEAFAKAQGVEFYPAGRGIGHQIMCEEGIAWPGTVTVASDSHANMYGGLGCFGTAIVPRMAKIEFTGSLPVGVTGKDVIIALSGLFNEDEVLNHAIEFTGSEETLRSLSIDSRLTISRFSHTRIDDVFANPISADKGANYDKHLFLNLSTLSPYISGPNSIKMATPLEQLAAQNIKINKSYLVSCTNSRASDLAAAARVFREASPAKIPDSVKFYIAAASMPEQRVAEEAGDWQVMLDAGAVALPAGCGPCIGLGTGLLEPGPGWYQQPEGGSGVVMGEGDGVKEEERMITAEEALEKIIGQLDNVIEGAEEEEDIASEAKTKKEIEILPGFPSKVSGTILFLDAENVSTDAIYPGKFTYKDDMTTEDMAEVCFQNYDPAFRDIAREGDVLVSGYNFGCGSSREQAATSILAKKIPLVVAVPKLVQRLRETFSSTETGSQQNSILEPSENRESLDSPPPAPQSSPKKEKKLTRRTDWKLTWDIRRSTVTVKEGENGPTWSQNVAALPPNVQDIIASGGLEKWVKKQIGTS